MDTWEITRNVLLTGGVLWAVHHLYTRTTRALASVRNMREQLLEGAGEPAPRPEGPAWAWAEGAAGLVVSREVDAQLSTGTARFVLAQAWKVTTPAEADSQLARLADEHPALETLRHVRAVVIAWLGKRSGALPDDKCEALLHEAREALSARHASWEALGAGYAEDLDAFTQHAKDRDHQRSTTERRIEEMRASVWVDVPWSTPDA